MISPTIQFGAVLRFLATGSYQMAVAKDCDINLGRSTFSKVLHGVLGQLERHLCSEWIRLEMSPQEMQICKEKFYERFSFPGVIGCVDGIHIRLLKPVIDGSLYFNRKGYYSLNAMLVCYMMLTQFNTHFY